MNIGQRVAVAWSSLFVRSVGVLVGGAALAHAINLIALPIVTRLYTPHDFSLLAVFGALVGVIGGIACLRFDIAIPLPTTEEDAANVLAVALISSTAISALLVVVVVGFPNHISETLNQPELRAYLWLLPIAVMAFGAYSATQLWFVRQKRFRALAESRVAQAGAAAGVQIGFGAFGLAPVGLLLGQIFNAVTGFAILTSRLLSSKTRPMHSLRISRMRSLIGTYQRFPKYSTFEALTNGAGVYVPVIIIAALAIGPEAGYLTLAMYVMQAPLSLVGGAIGQVYLSRAAEEYRVNRLEMFTVNVVGGLLKSGVGPLVFLGIVAPNAFGFIFGDEWRRAGILVAWMTPWFVMQFLAAPISMGLHVTSSQRTALILQIVGFGARVGAVYGAFAVAPDSISEVYALSGFAFYSVYFVVVMHSVSARVSNLVEEVRKSLPIIILWTAAGIGTATVMYVISDVRL